MTTPSMPVRVLCASAVKLPGSVRSLTPSISSNKAQCPNLVTRIRAVYRGNTQKSAEDYRLLVGVVVVVVLDHRLVNPKYVGQYLDTATHIAGKDARAARAVGAYRPTPLARLAGVWQRAWHSGSAPQC